MNKDTVTVDPKCTLTDLELIDKVDEWVSKLAKSGGQAWTLRVPVDFNNDPDMLIAELIKRFQSLSAPPSHAEVKGLSEGNIKEVETIGQGLYLWDGINDQLEGIESFEEAKEYIKEMFIDGNQIHPDIESIFVLKEIARFSEIGILIPTPPNSDTQVQNKI